MIGLSAWKICGVFFRLLSFQTFENESATLPEAAATATESEIATNLSVQPTLGSTEEGQQRDCWSVGRSQQSSKAITAVIHELGVRLLQNLETAPDQPNIIISPFSIALALSQLALGECVPLHLLKHFSTKEACFLTSTFLQIWLETVPLLPLLQSSYLQVQ